jgi:hypothetical protein
MLDAFLELPTWSTSRLVNRYRRVICDAVRKPHGDAGIIMLKMLADAIADVLARRGFAEDRLSAVRAQAVRKIRSQADAVAWPLGGLHPSRAWQGLTEPGWRAETTKRIQSFGSSPAHDWLYDSFVDFDYPHWAIDWRVGTPRAMLSFHPVGQGLFAAGHLIPAGGGPAFTWTFDCGSSSSQAFVGSAIDRLAAQSGGRDVIDLAVLSHFDGDHISGLVRLLARFKVKTLLIPLVALWQRLLVLFSSRAHVSSADTVLLLDPVPAIRAIAGDRVESIVLVPPSLGDGAPSRGPPIGDPQGPADDGPPQGDRPRRDSGRDGAPVLIHDARPARDEAGADTVGPAVSELPSGGVLRVPGLWEFVPYNDARRAVAVDTAFAVAADSLRTRLLHGATDEQRRDALKAMKRHYEAFYKTSKARNEISLFLYAGSHDATRAWMASRMPVAIDHAAEVAALVVPGNPEERRASVLYTGDGYLDRPDAWERLAAYLGPARASSLLVLQVMHHGARENWHEGLARSIAPTIAAFAANPANKRLRHPHDEVVDDFMQHSLPCLVDRVGLQVDIGL